MYNFSSNKNKRLISQIVVVVLVIAMLIGVIAPYL